MLCGFDSTSSPNLKKLIFQHRWEVSWQILIKLTGERWWYLILFQTKLSQNDMSSVELFVLHLPCQSCSSSRWIWEQWTLLRQLSFVRRNSLRFWESSYGFFLFFFPFWCPNQDLCVWHWIALQKLTFKFHCSAHFQVPSCPAQPWYKTLGGGLVTSTWLHFPTDWDVQSDFPSSCTGWLPLRSRLGLPSGVLPPSRSRLGCRLSSSSFLGASTKSVLWDSVQQRATALQRWDS